MILPFVRCLSRFLLNSLVTEIILRAGMCILFLYMEQMNPFNRQIHPDELWLYRNPRRDAYVSTTALWTLALLLPLVGTALYALLTNDHQDSLQYIMGLSLALGINCILTDMIKLIVGRPRPDFFWRCFPDGELNPEMQCSGTIHDVMEGRKSFPSGHSSISFCSMGFVSWWLMGKLQVWSERGRGRGVALIVSLFPLCVALAVALSRTCDYHHHWQDVLVGSLMGLSISYMVYRQYYPSFDANCSHRPYSRWGPSHPQHEDTAVPPPQDAVKSQALVKWI